MIKKNNRYFLLTLLLLLVTGCSSLEHEKMRAPHVSSSSHKAAAHYNVQLGLNYLQKGDVHRAKQKLLLASKQAPHWAPAQGAMGYLLETTGNPQAAEKYYRKAVRINPKAGAAQNNYGTFLCRQKRYASAEQHFMLAAQDANYLKTAEVYENAGLCALQAQQKIKAFTYLSKAVTQDPSLSTAWLELGQLNYQEKRYVQAQQNLDRYMRLKSEPSAEALWLGIRLGRQLNNPAATSRYTLMLQNQYPNSEEYRQLRSTPQPSMPKSKKPLYF